MSAGGAPVEQAIRDAATVILVQPGAEPRVLMGRRGAGAAFMPNRLVFPGGAVEAGDGEAPLAGLPDSACLSRLAGSGPSLPRALLAAAIRETWEETGLRLARAGAWPSPPRGWRGFAEGGCLPCAAGLRFVFRAVTPPGRPRRFDARFFLATTRALHGDTGALAGEGELSDLAWRPLAGIAREGPAFVTRLVLAEIPGLLAAPGPPARVPFLRPGPDGIFATPL